jgi:hypothetical protein
MSEFYQIHINNGKAPDRGFPVGLADYALDVLSKNPEYLDRPATALLTKAFEKIPGLIEEQNVIWNRAIKAAQEYYSAMSPERAKAFFEALPDDRLPRIAFAQVMLVSQVAFADPNMERLEEKFDEGELNAVDVGFRLIYISDGAASEWLFHALGEIVPKHPRLFLEKVAAHLGPKSREDSDWILDHILLDLVAWGEIPEDDDEIGTKREAMEARERELRIKALKSVEDRALLALRDLCLAKLAARDH